MPEIDIPDAAGGEPESGQALEFGAGRRAGLGGVGHGDQELPSIAPGPAPLITVRNL